MSSKEIWLIAMGCALADWNQPTKQRHGMDTMHVYVFIYPKNVLSIKSMKIWRFCVKNCITSQTSRSLIMKTPYFRFILGKLSPHPNFLAFTLILFHLRKKIWFVIYCIMFHCVITCFVNSFPLNAIPFQCLIFASWYVSLWLCVCVYAFLHTCMCA